MMEFLTWLEESRVATAISGSTFLYPSLLTLHSIGMAFVVGVNTAIGLFVLGVAPGTPLALLKKYLPVVWLGFVVNLITGLLLGVASASRVLSDPVFFLKMVFVILGTVNLKIMQGELTGAVSNVSPSLGGTISGGVVAVPAVTPVKRIRRLAIASMVYWAAAVTLGRMMGYTFFRFWQ